jgi:hypothetical protein
MEDLLPSARLMTCGLFEVARVGFFVLDALGVILVLTVVLLVVGAGLAMLVALFVSVNVDSVELVLATAAVAAALDATALDAAAAAACCCALVCAASTGVDNINNIAINMEVGADFSLLIFLISYWTQCRLGTSKFPLNLRNNISVFA